MPKPVRRIVKSLLERSLPDDDRFLHLSLLPVFRAWKKSAASGVHTESRYALYDWLNTNVLKDQALDFLEFGVFEGASIRYWSNLNHHPDSRFFGFDTFTGLPESWSAGHGHKVPPHTFSTDGKIPRIDDSRVTFVSGLFQETLRDFLEGFQGRGRLIIHNDADLYSATLYTLATCDPIIRRGSILLFDEFYSVLHEFRAFMDYVKSFMKEYEVLGHSGDFYQVALRIL